jgi:hypothetical protein
LFELWENYESKNKSEQNITCSVKQEATIPFRKKFKDEIMSLSKKQQEHIQKLKAIQHRKIESLFKIKQKQITKIAKLLEKYEH